MIIPDTDSRANHDVVAGSLLPVCKRSLLLSDDSPDPCCAGSDGSEGSVGSIVECSCSIAPQTVHTPSRYWWAVIGTTVPSSRTMPHVLQITSPLYPSLVQVASLSLIRSISACPLAGRIVSSFRISCVIVASMKYRSHFSQCQYSMLPSSVQVAAFSVTCVPTWTCSSCSSAT